MTGFSEKTSACVVKNQIMMVNICVRRCCFEFLSVKGLCPLTSHKGLCPLTPPLFEKSGQKLFIVTAESPLNKSLGNYYYSSSSVSSSIGNVNVTVVPTFSVLSISRLPLCRCIISSTTASPIPDPLCT